MKRLAIFCLSIIAVAFNACERHDVSELDKIREQPEAHEAAKKADAEKK